MWKLLFASSPPHVIDCVPNEMFETLCQFRMRTEADHTAFSVLPLCNGGRALHHTFGRTILCDFCIERCDDFVVVDLWPIRRCDSGVPQVGQGAFSRP